MDPSASVNQGAVPKRRFGCLSVLGLMLLTILISVAVTVWVLSVYLFPKRFEPVQLSAGEEQVLAHKLEVFEGAASPLPDESAVPVEGGKLEPLPYSEAGADRSVTLSEREINALLAKNTDLADKLAIDLADNLISARLRVPVDPDFPVLGGKLVKARAGVEVSFTQGRPVVVLKGISVMGVPVPNAWLGGLKNIDLVSRYGEQEGFWRSFAAGVEHVKVVEGGVQFKLKE